MLMILDLDSQLVAISLLMAPDARFHYLVDGIACLLMPVMLAPLARLLHNLPSDAHDARSRFLADR